MNYYDLKQVLERPNFRIFRMDNPALLISFLYREFKVKGKVVIEESNLEENLSFYIKGIDKDLKTFENSNVNVTSLLNEWSNRGFLRRTAPFGKSEREFELTPSMEKVLQYIEDNQKKEFVGTESRLLNIFDLLREIAFHTSDNPEERIKELEKKKFQIENEILEIQKGNLKKFTNTQLKERYIELYDTSRKLLSDFREVEQNFREIDFEIREKVIESVYNRGNLLSQILEKENFLYESDQGKSFQAFLEFLVSEEKKEELETLIDILLSLSELNNQKADEEGIDKERFFRNLKRSMILESQKVGKTNSKIAEGLKKFIVEKSFMENKRIMEIVQEIKKEAISLKKLSISREVFYEIDDKPEINLVMERPLFIPPEEVVLENVNLGVIEEEIFSLDDISKLFQRNYINKDELIQNVKKMLKNISQVSLRDVIKEFPSDKGLLDILGYFSLTTDGLISTIDESTYEIILVVNKTTGKSYKVKVPTLVFHNES